MKSSKPAARIMCPHSVSPIVEDPSGYAVVAFQRYNVCEYGSQRKDINALLKSKMFDAASSRRHRRRAPVFPPPPLASGPRDLSVLGFERRRTLTIYRFPLRLDIIRKMSCVNLSIYFNSLGILCIFNGAAHMS